MKYVVTLGLKQVEESSLHQSENSSEGLVQTKPLKVESINLIRYVPLLPCPHPESMFALQELEKGSIPDDEIPAKLNELCKLCSNNRLIPDSMKFRDDGNESLKATHYTHPSQIFQGEFKGRKVAVKIIRLHVPQKLDEPLGVSTRSPQYPIGEL